VPSRIWTATSRVTLISTGDRIEFLPSWVLKRPISARQRLPSND